MFLRSRFRRRRREKDKKSRRGKNRGERYRREEEHKRQNEVQKRMRKRELGQIRGDWVREEKSPVRERVRGGERREKKMRLEIIAPLLPDVTARAMGAGR